MPCTSPLKGYQSRERNPSGKRSIVFSYRDGYSDLPITVPCGQCIGCRIDRSRMWAVRCVHEASLHERNCFVTLTYDDSHLPSDMSVSVRPLQKFMKRLRKRFGSGIRFFACGEYGENTFRPHYHLILFNFDFPDKVFFKMSGKNRLYTSDSLSSIWPQGHCLIGDVTFESAAYVARYIVKKVTGDLADSHYRWIASDGVVYDRKPEFITMSRRPGIAADWVRQYGSDVYPSDFVVVNGQKVKVPRFYDSKLDIEDLHSLKASRKLRAKDHLDDQSDSRLLVKSKVNAARLKKLPRNLE